MSGSIGFAAVRGMIRLLLAVFYRRIEVVGAERVPERGGLIVAANHHNSIVDAMILLAADSDDVVLLPTGLVFEKPGIFRGWGIAAGVAFAVVEAVTVLVLRAHYTMDVLRGALAALR